MFLTPGGYATLIGPDGMKQADTFTCAHCNRLVIVKPGTQPEDVCWHCMDAKRPLAGLICKACVAKRRCAPHERWLETVERNFEKARAVAGYFTCT